MKKQLCYKPISYFYIKILNNLGVVQKNFGALEDATNSLEEALRIASELGDEGIRMRTVAVMLSRSGFRVAWIV